MSEVKKLRKSCLAAKAIGKSSHRFTQIRNWFMIELGLNAGLRVTEMTTLKHQDLLIDSGRSSIKIIGKGKKKRLVWINSIFKKICVQYLNYKKQQGYQTSEDSYLLNNRRGTRITKRSLQKFFKILSALAKLPSRYSIHCLRHTYATHLLEASNHNYRFVQSQLGHSSIRTTQVYAGIIEKQGRVALEKLYRNK